VTHLTVPPVPGDRSRHQHNRNDQTDRQKSVIKTVVADKKLNGFQKNKRNTWIRHQDPPDSSLF